MKSIKLKVTNSFIIELEPKGFLLIDTGYHYEKGVFLKELSRLGIDLKEIGYLLLTHHHNDHCGLLNFITEQNPDIKIIAHQNAVELLAEGRNDNSSKAYAPNRLVRFLINLAFMLDKNWTPEFPVFKIREQDILIKKDVDADTLKSIGLEATIIYTPGHCRDHISVVQKNGDVFSGDACGNMMEIAGMKHTPLRIENLDAIYSGWEDLLNLGAKTIYPSHGKPFPAKELLSNMRKIKKEKLAELKN